MIKKDTSYTCRQTYPPARNLFIYNPNAYLELNLSMFIISNDGDTDKLDYPLLFDMRLI